MGIEEDDRSAFLRRFRNRLPQWRLPGSVYFATWHLHSGQLELAPEERQLVVSALLHFNQDRYYIYAFVVMNDHVHVLLKPLENYDFGKILHSWKSFTANQLQRKHRRIGNVWQKDTRTHIIRDEDDFYTKAEYILTTPHRRWPEIPEYEWVAWLGFPEA
jgi:REP element-mobilizing transposase RayT